MCNTANICCCASALRAVESTDEHAHKAETTSRNYSSLLRYSFLASFALAVSAIPKQACVWCPDRYRWSQVKQLSARGRVSNAMKAIMQIDEFRRLRVYFALAPSVSLTQLIYFVNTSGESELWLRAVSAEFVTSSAAKPLQALLVPGRIACQK